MRNNLLTTKISDLEKELSNQKIKNEELKKDISAFNIEKQEFINQIQTLQNELNKFKENPKIENYNGNIITNEDKKEIDNKEFSDIELIKDENINLKKEIESLQQNVKDLNQELDAYEKEAIESEQEVNLLKESNSNLILIREQLLKELENYKNNGNIKEIKEENNKEKLINNSNNIELFSQKLKNFVNKVTFKDKIKLYIDMVSTQKMENLIIENAKLNSEKIELNQKVEVLTEIINNPESFNKYVDENGNINLPYYNGEEGNDYMNNVNNGINEEQNEKK